MKEVWLRHRGALRDLLSWGDELLFVTEHPEGQPTALYRVDPASGASSAEPLPGGRALVSDGEQIYVACADGRVRGGAPNALEVLGPALDPVALALVAHHRLAVLSGAEVVVLARSDGAEVQRLALPERGQVIAADASGEWLVVGTDKGTVAVFHCEGRDAFVAGDAARLHEGPVTALCFDREGQRVLTGGADARLLSVHLRGALDAEDRGGRNGHDEAVTALVWGARRLYSAGRDGALKAWAPGKKRPSTQRDGVGRAVALAPVESSGKAYLAVAADDASLRLFPLDAEGKPGARSHVLRDAYARAVHELAHKAPARRQKALDALREYGDARSIELLAEAAEHDRDHALRVRATEHLGATGGRRAVRPLEALLDAGSERVRRAALAGLRGLAGEGELRPLELAIESGHADVGVAAVEALGALAEAEGPARTRLVSALSDEPAAVRLAALETLEGLYPADAADADRIGLGSGHPDVRRRALLRFVQRDLLGRDEVRLEVRRAAEDPDADVRRAAFLVGVLSRPALAKALRARDKALHRQLHELQTLGRDVALPKQPKRTPRLTADDTAPLLEAMASRALDTSLAGTVQLAALGDRRAFGNLLQLTRSRDPGARVEAARALARLGDPRGVQRLRLMLTDPEGQVRDAAFTALARLRADAPLDAAEAGLSARHEDVRRRGLGLLLEALSAVRTLARGERPADLLARALNDAAPAVRSEAFKATLALKLDDDDAARLAFIADTCLFADVRREVVTELMARIEEPWAWPSLLKLLDDPAAALRAEVFEFAHSKNNKGRDPDARLRALRGRYADTRLAAVTALAKQSAEMPGALIEAAAADADERVRLAALAALETAEHAEGLRRVMRDARPDTRVRAAAARAAWGDPDALAPLVELATAPRPQSDEARTGWRDVVVRALDGLAALGDPAAVEIAAPHLHAEAAELRHAAARVLAWCADTDPLAAALRHEDEEVRKVAAAGLAWLGDPVGSSILFPAPPPEVTGVGASATGPRRRRATRRRAARRRSTAAAPELPPAPPASLYAALTLDEEDRFLTFLDHPDAAVRDRALKLLMLLEWAEGDGEPDRCLAALSAADPRARLAGARLLERFAEPAAFIDEVVARMNDRGDHQKPWGLSAELLAGWAHAVTHADGRTRVRAARLFEHLEPTNDDAPRAGFDRAWRRFAARFPEAATATTERVAPAVSAEEVHALVFGAYVGLSRHGGAREAGVRAAALARLRALLDADAVAAEAAVPVFLQALADGHHIVRAEAFEALATRLEPGRLAEAALATGIGDVGARGLVALAAADASTGLEVIEAVVRGHTDGLEAEALKLLGERVGAARAFGVALEAAQPGLRRRAAYGLAALPDDAAAADALRAATRHGDEGVRSIAIAALAARKDGSAFRPAKALLGSENAEAQVAAAEALLALGDPRAVDAIVDRIVDDPSGTAQHDALLGLIGEARRPDAADRLLALFERPRLYDAAWSAVFTLSGHDQWWSWDAETDDVDRASIEDDHPRHHGLVTRLLEATRDRGDTRRLRMLLSKAQWARDPDFDEVLAPLAEARAPELRRQALEVIGWRLRRRGGPAEPLVRALEHADPLSAFLAAEGLARGGHAEGIGTLLAAIDYVESVDQRRRAVKALGELGDARALDVLLRLVNEDAHALQEEAAEAIGHLAGGARADAIFAVLRRLSRGQDGVAQRALVGLRHFGTRDAWHIIRERAADHDWSVREAVAKLLAHDDDEASRAALVTRIEEDDDWDVVMAAGASLRAQYGPDSLEPDYVFVRSEFDDIEADTVARLRAGGEPARLMETLPKIHEDLVDAYRAPLEAALLAREPLPVEAAAAALGHPEAAVAAVAARVLGRAAAGHGDAVAEATAGALAAWRGASTRAAAGEPGAVALGEAAQRLRWLLWACGRLGVGAEHVVAAAELPGDAARPLRHAALHALAAGLEGQGAVDALAAAAVGPDADLRTLAAAGLAERAPARAATLLEALLDDRSSFDRLLEGVHEDGREVLRAGAARGDVQGAALPRLVALRDVEGLRAAAFDRALAEHTRLGALEALAMVPEPSAEAALLDLATDERESEALRKAAWRARRRWRRRAP